MKSILTLLCLLFYSLSYAQQDRYVIELSDKGNSIYSLNNPQDFLSTRSINRRLTQGIAIDSSDLPISPVYINAIANTGAQILNQSKWLNTVTIFTTNPTVLSSIQSLPFVNNVKNVGRFSSNNPYPSKKLFENISPLKTIHPFTASVLNYGPSERQIKMMNGDALHDLGFRGNGMLIAVIDAGFFFSDSMIVFDSLRANNQIIATYDFVDRETNVYNDHMHGSYVLSTMAGYWEGNIIGTAPKASYLLLRSEDVNSEFIIEEYNWASAAEFADSAGADIINSSLGYTEFNDSTQNHVHADQDGLTTPVSRAAGMASLKGLVVCNSAGNEGNSPWQKIMCPADAINILAVAAVDSAGVYASFSSRGHSADGRIKPDVAAMGLQTIVASPFAPIVHGGNGTSFASPLMAGMAACLWQAYPNKSNSTIMQAIRSSASQFPNPDSLLSYGIPNFNQAFNALGIPDVSGSGNDWLIYPIPFQESINVHSLSNDLSAEITMFDMTGRLIFQSQFAFHQSVLQIPTSPFSKGTYIIQYRSDSVLLRKKIIKL